MESKPELIAFSQYKLGGVQNFYYNILSKIPQSDFEIRWIFEEAQDSDPKLPALYGITEEIIFPLSIGRPESTLEMAKRLSLLVSNRPGIVLSNFWHDLVSLHLFRKPAKTIFFICHDEAYVDLAVRYSFLIDVFLAHNKTFSELLKVKLPDRSNDIYYIPYGVNLPSFSPGAVHHNPLRIIIAARMQKSKGIYDIPLIDDVLIGRGIRVQWVIVGSGPEEQPFRETVSSRENFEFHAPVKNDSVLDLMRGSDLFILPSRLDGLPVALLESMSMGCVPVISAFNEGIKDVVNSSVGFVLPVGEIDAFADAIATMHTNREKLHSMSTHARLEIEANYNIDKQSEKYNNLFRDFQQLKKPARRKFIKYGGWLDLPIVPAFIRNAIRFVKKSISAA